MSQLAIVTDLNRCVGCLACSTACKAAHGIDPGVYWIKTLRVGPNPIEGGSGQYPDVEMYFLPVQCQHCLNPECVSVCPVGATFKAEDGTVQIDAEACIGCSACVSACPYGVRYIDAEAFVAQKCDLCADLVAEGALPACVAQCGGRARFFGDLDNGIESFEAPWVADITTGAVSYEECRATRTTIAENVPAFTEDQLYQFPDMGNAPAFYYILRNRKWQDGDFAMKNLEHAF